MKTQKVACDKAGDFLYFEAKNFCLKQKYSAPSITLVVNPFNKFETITAGQGLNN
ncbi:hypothetical protein G7092_13920 [Mucilaginibacter sp. HC2]|uniref:hypothetical protein n=1 Tax=Mucilaginibacter inviolabilis TaxID=2714892 RepID=UPI001408A192|nr:hypothetical protein [Mucilaginibacter inviolabilis]NHA04904.1 hypothetical protein [Mucilaginibacter inviolabilis]